ncbi:MAG TPA: hypothetical protein VE134_09240, partial [Methanomicrobiales archaeon]|nr:hypothetical protein [Methanomicrobiales archaeon]
MAKDSGKGGEKKKTKGEESIKSKAADVKKEKGEENGKTKPVETRKAKSEAPAKVTSDDVKKIVRDWRVMAIIVLCVVSIIAIAPSVQDGKLNTALQFGLDLQGGAWLQLEFNSIVVGFDTDRPVQDFISDLQKSLDAEVYLIDNNKLEIRKLMTEQEISSALTANGGHLVSYQQGVSQDTADDVKRILEEKLNTLGTKDAKVNTLTDFSG